MLHSPCSSSIGLKTDPSGPPCQGGRNDALDEGFFNDSFPWAVVYWKWNPIVATRLAR